MRSLRVAIMHDDLPAMFLAIEKARDAKLAAVVQPELNALLCELDERAVVSEVLVALKTGAVKAPSPGDGSPASGNGSVSITELDDALDFGDQMKPKSAKAKAALETAVIIRAIRQCERFRGCDMVPVRQCVSQCLSSCAYAGVCLNVCVCVLTANVDVCSGH